MEKFLNKLLEDITFAANLGGSMDRGNVKDKASQSWGKQMSLHDELLSHERLTANEEMRRKIQKQQSLPDNHDQGNFLMIFFYFE